MARSKMEYKMEYTDQKKIATDALTKITQTTSKGRNTLGPTNDCVRARQRSTVVWVGHPQAVPTAVGPRAAAAAGGRYGALRTAAGVAESPRARRALICVERSSNRETIRYSDQATAPALQHQHAEV